MRTSTVLVPIKAHWRKIKTKRNPKDFKSTWKSLKTSVKSLKTTLDRIGRY